MVETTGEIVARLLHERGGYVLVVGGGLTDLPQRFLTHPQILIWDDTNQAWENKTVPANTRAILTSKFMSHSQRYKLQNAAKALHITMWPMLTHREIREALAYVAGVPAELQIPAGEKMTAPEQVAVEGINLAEVAVPEAVEAASREPAKLLMETDVMRKLKRGEYAEVIPKHYEPGLGAAELSTKVYKALRNDKVDVTETAVKQATYAWLKKNEGKDAAKAKPGTTTVTHVQEGDEFAEAERMLKDARVAIDLALEAVGNLRKSTAEIRKRQARLKELLLG